SAPSLFSAVETPQPVTASRADASAPLFISAEPEAAAKAAKPAKKTTKKAAAKAAADSDEATTTEATTTEGTTTEATDGAANEAESGQVAGKKAAGKKTAGKKAAGKKAAEKKSAEKKTAEKKTAAQKAAPVESAEAVPGSSDDEPVAGESTPDESAQQSTGADETIAASPEASTDRASDQGAEAADTGAADTEAADTETSDTETSDNGADHGHRSDHDSRSRRRRRGRRGRGRGRGDQGTDGEGTDHDGTADSEETGAEAARADSSAEAASASATTARAAADGEGAGSAVADAESADTQSAGTASADSESTDSESAATESADSESTDTETDDADGGVPSSKRRRRRRRRRGGSDTDESASDDPPNTVVHEREPRTKRVRDEVQGISGSTRLEAKRQRRRDGRDAGRRRPPILTESEFLARRESVERVMVVRERAANSAITSSEPHAAPTEDYTQIAVLEDGVLVEHFVTTETSQSMVGNIYLGRVQNVLPGMEAAFVDIGRGRNGVLYAGEVNWEAAGLDGGSRKIEQALKPGDHVLVQVSKDPIGHKGARLTTQISLAGRYLVYVPGGTSTGISRKLPDTERRRLKQILAKIVPDEAGVIVRTASEGVSAEELGADIERLEAQWRGVQAAAEDHKAKGSGTPKPLYEEPDLLVRVVRDLFNEDFRKLVIEGDRAWAQVSDYVGDVAPDLAERLDRFTKNHADSPDSFAVYRIDEQLAKALDRKVWLPSGGTLIIEHTEAMTVVDVNTGKFTGSGGNLEETVTRNNLEAAEEIVRQMRLRDIGGMIIVDFIDMVLESNRDLVLRRLTEALARDRTRHQVSEVTSLGLVQMTRKRLGTGLLEAFSTTCTTCAGRGVIVHANPVEVRPTDGSARGDNGDGGSKRSRRSRRRSSDQPQTPAPEQPKVAHKPASEHPMFRAMAHGEELHGHDHDHGHDHGHEHGQSRDHAESVTVEATRVETVVVVEAEQDVVVAAAVEQVSTETVFEKTGAEKTGTEKTGAEPAAVEPAAAVAASADREAGENTSPAPTVRRRRRAVRRTAAPTAVAEPVEATVPDTPVTTVAPQASEPVVAVKRTARRRSGRRVAGPPPAQQ
ncbi:MAG: Rne/Rng family ribonuclease, partial [Gordonia sp. (in: high G+C Gram-positive bacteria)]